MSDAPNQIVQYDSPINELHWNQSTPWKLIRLRDGIDKIAKYVQLYFKVSNM